MYFLLLRLLTGAAAAAFLFFWGLNNIGTYIVDRFYDSNYVTRRELAYVEKLQRYIDEKELDSRNAGALNSWVKKQKMISVQIYKDDILIFDSEYPEQVLWDEDIALNEYVWENYYTVTFSDGSARVSIWGTYAYQLYNYVLLAAVAVSFLLFLALVLLGIRTKMNYILLLNDEIKILESGSLDYKITVKGKDELAALAEGLDCMRESFRNLIDSEAKIMNENRKIITEMSHDLRTPVTSIMLYTEILKKGKYKSEEQLTEYLEKIDRKACRMKQLTDHLFEYSLVTGETEIVLEEAETFEVLFYDLISESCSYLQQKGFRTEVTVEWIGRKTIVCTDYIIRMMDNIVSNIIKYADMEVPVVVCSVCEGNMAGFAFENAVRKDGDKAESTCVGIQSIKSMMVKMNGSCRVRQGQEQFRIELLFPLL
ncbi:Sensor protein kinase WalK [Acetatifactor muris]|jgi:signal transduction histidine kinase|uniref:histidine kinase n=2 Tax=Acetatifactor muris TaxID=879566 RepID=A0A2K4ZMZ4_9FIRM|nr:HAMP domain-containing histidine kinase [Lachnospiraceae bacterium]SOY31772.1 Sensor protein kinase WalK [Acetatifactor muris]